ncbi:hypothetical protein [Noviherbaspirillum soli]|uniref:hypothetical protein n=1 Tax=Noviherbaspirillum soli TaxID=1064518 RepID=UPI00188A30B5|nr:hypothetical protein [Noviherbaspirillum soli]
MAQPLCFYRDLTEIAEKRITELILQAGTAERRDDAPFPEAGGYYRACALTVFLAWNDVTEGWQTRQDRDRLAALAGADGLEPACSAQAPLPGISRGRARLDA